MLKKAKEARTSFPLACILNGSVPFEPQEVSALEKSAEENREFFWLH